MSDLPNDVVSDILGLVGNVLTIAGPLIPLFLLAKNNNNKDIIMDELPLDYNHFQLHKTTDNKIQCDVVDGHVVNFLCCSSDSDGKPNYISKTVKGLNNDIDTIFSIPLGTILINSIPTTSEVNAPMNTLCYFKNVSKNFLQTSKGIFSFGFDGTSYTIINKCSYPATFEIFFSSTDCQFNYHYKKEIQVNMSETITFPALNCTNPSMDVTISVSSFNSIEHYINYCDYLIKKITSRKNKISENLKKNNSQINIKK